MSNLSFQDFAKKTIHALKEIEADLGNTEMGLSSWFSVLEEELGLDPYSNYSVTEVWE
jgi:hypothetical protein